MMEVLILITATSLLSSALTWAVAYLFFRWKVKGRLQQELDELGDVLKGKLREGVEEAGRELMPELRDEVREGFKEALAQAMAGDIIEQSAKTAVQRGSSMVETGLRFLMGQPRPGEPGPGGPKQT